MTERQGPGFAEHIAQVFPDYYETDDGREALLNDLARLGAQETARQFGQAERILEAYMHAAEEISVCLYVALGEAKSLAWEARQRAEAYADAAT